MRFKHINRIVILAGLALAGCSEGAVELERTHLPPVAEITPPTCARQACLVGTSTLWSGENSRSGGAAITTWEWSLEDGTLLGSEPSLETIFSRGGTRQIKLVVRDEKFFADTAELQISVNEPPVAAITPPACVSTRCSVGEETFWSSEESRDANDRIERSIWRWDYGARSDTTHNAFFTFEEEGTKTVRLVVEDGYGSADTTAYNITISDGNTPPTARISRPTCASGTCGAGVETEWSARESEDGDGEIVSWMWRFGDGSGETYTEETTHVFPDAGVYTVELIVQDDYGQADSTSTSIEIGGGDAPPTLLSPPEKHGIVWEPATEDEAAGMNVDAFVESDGSGGFRMIYQGVRHDPEVGYQGVVKYAESSDGFSWPASRRGYVTIEESGEATRGFSLRRVARKADGGYYTISFDHGEGDMRGAGLWEAAELRGPWRRTGTIFPPGRDFSEPAGALGWVPEIGRHINFIRPVEEYQINGRTVYWRSVKKVEGSRDLSSWWPDLSGNVEPELTTGGVGQNQYYHVAPVLVNGVINLLVMQYHLDDNFRDTGNRSPEGDDNTMDVRLFTSTDYGDSWTAEYSGEPFLPRGAAGSWEGGQVYATNPVVVGDLVYIFYVASEQPHVRQHEDSHTTYSNEKPYRMGLAISRLK